MNAVMANNASTKRTLAIKKRTVATITIPIAREATIDFPPVRCDEVGPFFDTHQSWSLYKIESYNTRRRKTRAAAFQGRWVDFRKT